MENDCKNHRRDWCRLTEHWLDGLFIAYRCAYPHNCKECKDYKPQNRRDDPKKSVSAPKPPESAPSGV